MTSMIVDTYHTYVECILNVSRYRSANKKAKYHESGGLTPTEEEENIYVSK